MNDDMELLQAFVAHHSEEAFARLVERHVNLVYSVALRYTSNPAHAQDITQAVFVILARKAPGLSPNTILSGWLYQTARLNAFNFNRTETRRRRRDQEAYMQSLTAESEPVAWERVAPWLDLAMAGLGEADRNAVVLRFMAGKNFQEVGVALGASEDAAKMRVHRALEKLRKFFTRKGVVLSGAALAGIISANAVSAAPAGMAGAATAAAVKGAALSAPVLALVKGATDIMKWTTKLKIAAAVAAVAVIASESYEVFDQQRTVTALQQELQSQAQKSEQQLQTQQALIDQLQQQKDAVVQEKDRDQEFTARMLNKQRAEAAQAIAQANTAKAQADQFVKQTKFNALAELWKDPGQQEVRRRGYRQIYKGRYGGLASELKLSPEDTDKFIELFVDNEMKKQDRVAGMWAKTMDMNTAIQLRENDAKDLENTIRSWLGDDAAAAYDRVQRNNRVSEGMSFVNQTAGGNAMTEEQVKHLQDIAGAQPEIYFDSEDYFRGSKLTEALLQQYRDRDQAIMNGASDFLTPEQLSALAAVSSNRIEEIRKVIDLNHNLFKK